MLLALRLLEVGFRAGVVVVAGFAASVQHRIERVSGH
jgi:hypothetical protein